MSGLSAISAARGWRKRSDPVTWNGETLSYQEWADLAGLECQMLMDRLYRGMDMREALIMPPGGHRITNMLAARRAGRNRRGDKHYHRRRRVA
jgi:hypothetical protein